MDLQQGQIVKYDHADVKITGKVCGFATISNVVIGRSVIVEIIEAEGIDKAIYPYSHVALMENLLTVNEEVDPEQLLSKYDCLTQLLRYSPEDANSILNHPME